MKSLPMGARPRAYIVAAISGSLIGQIAGCSGRAPDSPAVPNRVSTAQVAGGFEARSSNATVSEFTKFALNALLLPLLDDDVPARWADPSISVDCYDARVTVDGNQLDVGSPVPDAFAVRWHMETCTPMGQGIELSGDVELQVETNLQGYSAKVRPAGLLVRTAAGAHMLNEPFTALLAVDGRGP